MKTVDLSGLSGGYENICQQMLKNGIDYLTAKGLIGAYSGIAYKEYEGVVGIAIPNTPEAEALDKAIMAGIDGATGAMHQCVVGHLKFIAKKGVDGWLAEFHDEPNRYFEWDGTEKSCPETEISRRMKSIDSQKESK